MEVSVVKGFSQLDKKHFFLEWYCTLKVMLRIAHHKEH